MSIVNVVVHYWEGIKCESANMRKRPRKTLTHPNPIPQPQLKLNSNLTPTLTIRNAMYIDLFCMLYVSFAHL